ncbi:hypothetical protein FJZ31_23580 [Candidatus Poribacteria bacterium]|nr:hypothetical protein [Candidatus Poribacteria bacterium]
MNESINVRTIQTLGNLKNAFIGFSVETQESLIAIENELRRTMDWLKGEVDVRHRHIMRCRDEVDFASRALRECEAQEDDDYVPDCRAEIYELQEARRSLRHAEDELKIARLWFSKIQKAIQQFGTHVRRLKDLATDRTESAKAFLDRATSDLERYLGIPTPTTETSVPLIDAFPTRATTTTASTQTGIANLSGKTSGQWVERGVVEIDVANLPMPEDISKDLDFQKVPMDEMKAGLKMLQEMLPIIESGVGASKEYWAKRDNELGLDYPNGYLRIYEAFYGHDAIRVEKSGNNYDIVNGRHRIWLAKQMGIGKLPVSLVELESKP